MAPVPKSQLRMGQLGSVTARIILEGEDVTCAKMVIMV